MTENKKTGPSLSAPPPSKPMMSLEERLRKARADFERSFKDFHELLQNKLLKENKSDAANKQEKFIVDQIVKACVSLDNISNGEGVMALAVVALREHLKVRDRVNELEYQLAVCRKEINKLKKDLGSE